MINKKAQLDMKGMVIKYIIAFFFVTITVVALSQMGILGKVTPGGGVKDLETTGPGHITAAATVDINKTNINKTEQDIRTNITE